MPEIDPSEYTVDELKNEVVDIESAAELNEILEAEKEGKNRKTAKEAIERRLEGVEEEEKEGVEAVEDELEKATEEMRDQIRSGLDTVNENFVDVLSRLLQTPARTQVYVSLRRLGEANSEQIAEDTGIYPDKVEKILNEFEDDGIAKKTNSGYTAHPPTDAVKQLRDRINNAIERELTGGKKGKSRSWEFNPNRLPYKIVVEEKDKKEAK